MDESQDRAAHGGAQSFTRADLQLMADELTMGDVWRSRKESEDRAEVGMRSFWHAAMRLELIAKDVDFPDFIDRVRSEDFRAVNAPSSESKSESSEPKPD